MKRVLPALISGVLFGVGLALAGMTQPSKVVGFLDFFGNWDPSLAFVMGGAIAVHFLLFRMVMKRASPLLDDAFRVPTRRDLTPQLIVGSGIFGIGWGLGGYCPGPGITSLPTLGFEAATFVLAMAAGMLLYERVPRPGTSPVAKAPSKAT